MKLILFTLLVFAGSFTIQAQTTYRLGEAHNGYQVWLDDHILYQVISEGERYTDGLIKFCYSRPDRELALDKVEVSLHKIAASYNVNGATEEILFNTLFDTMRTRFSNNPKFLEWYNRVHRNNPIRIE